MRRGISARSIRAAVIAAVYAAFVWAFPQISFGPWQARVADILNPLPYIMGFEAVVGLTVGTLLANLVSYLGVWDLVIGTACTLTYSLINYGLGRVFGYRKVLLPVVAVVDTLVVGAMIGVLLLSYIAGLGSPLAMFISLLPGELVVNLAGALILAPSLKRYLARAS